MAYLTFRHLVPALGKKYPCYGGALATITECTEQLQLDYYDMMMTMKHGQVEDHLIVTSSVVMNMLIRSAQ